MIAMEIASLTEPSFIIFNNPYVHKFNCWTKCYWFACFMFEINELSIVIDCQQALSSVCHSSLILNKTHARDVFFLILFSRVAFSQMHYTSRNRTSWLDFFLIFNILSDTFQYYVKKVLRKCLFLLEQHIESILLECLTKARTVNMNMPWWNRRRKPNNKYK